MSSGTPEQAPCGDGGGSSYWRPSAWPGDPRARATLERLLVRTPGREDFAFEQDFRGADLDGAPLAHVWFGLSTFAGVGLRGAVLDKAHLDGADLSGADLSGARLHEATLVEAVAAGTAFRGAKLTDVTALRAVLAGSDLRGAQVSGADFSGADLRGADWRGADGRWVSLEGARVGGMRVAGFSGDVVGPADVGERDDVPEVLDGEDLRAWFAERGADVEVRGAVRQPPTR